MTHAYKIAGFGLAAGAAVMLALTAPAVARGPMGAGGAGGAGLFAAQFTDLDADADGQITEAELVARAELLAAERHAEVDADGDGTVTAEELEARILARIEDRMQSRMGQGRRAGDPAEMAATMVERMLSARDANEDGVLSGEELSPAADMARLIDRFDTDDDNAWSEEEFAQISARRAGFGEGRWSRGGWDGKRR